MRGLREHRRRPGHYGRNRLRHSDEDIGAEGDPYRPCTFGPIRTRQACKRIKAIWLAVAWLVVSRWAYAAKVSAKPAGGVRNAHAAKTVTSLLADSCFVGTDGGASYRSIIRW